MATLFETLQKKMNKKMGIPAYCCFNDAVLKELCQPHPDRAKIKEMVASKHIPGLTHATTGDDAVVCNATANALDDDEVLIDLDDGQIIFGSGGANETVSDKLAQSLKAYDDESFAPNAPVGMSDGAIPPTCDSKTEAGRILQTAHDIGSFPKTDDTNTQWCKTDDGLDYRAKLRSGFDRALRENILQIHGPSPEFLKGIGCTEDEFYMVQDAVKALMTNSWPKEVWDKAFPNGVSAFEIEKAMNPQEYASRGTVELPGKEGRQTVIGKNRFE